jgi:hypothetical protein
VTARIETAWRLHGLECLRLENQHLAMSILPERGGNIFSLVDKTLDRDVLWKALRVTPRLAPLKGNFDDYWAGGWDEAFPGGAPSLNRHGDELPYMGEVWSTPATWRIEQGGPELVELRLDVETPITPARFSRTIRLRDREPSVEIEYTIEHLGGLPFDYAWGIHPSLAISEHHRLDVPATHGEADASDVLGQLLGEAGQRYEWPVLNGEDLRLVRRADLGAAGLHYLTGLTAGWVASTDTAARRGFGLCFDAGRFPAVWLVLGYGGFRGFYQALLEPWTAYPTRLSDAVAAGRASVLTAGERVSTSVTAVLYDGVTEVASLSPDGTVSGAKR